MKITDAFTAEHAVLTMQMDHLEAFINNPLPEIPHPGQVQARAALLAAALSTHAGLEDKLLFLPLEAILGANGPLAVMRREHEIIESGLERIQHAEDPAEVSYTALEVIQTARVHFDKEERVLFRLAHIHLGVDALLELGQEWARQRKVQIAQPLA